MNWTKIVFLTLPCQSDDVHQVYTCFTVTSLQGNHLDALNKPSATCYRGKNTHQTRLLKKLASSQHLTMFPHGYVSSSKHFINSPHRATVFFFLNTLSWCWENVMRKRWDRKQKWEQEARSGVSSSIVSQFYCMHCFLFSPSGPQKTYIFKCQWTEEPVVRSCVSLLPDNLFSIFFSFFFRGRNIKTIMICDWMLRGRQLALSQNTQVYYLQHVCINSTFDHSYVNTHNRHNI